MAACLPNSRCLTLRLVFSLLVLSAIPLWGQETKSSSSPPNEQVTFFEQHIRPLLVEKCFECHSSDKEINGGLSLESRPAWQKGGDSGPALVPGSASTSLLMKAVEYRDPDLQMPPDGPLSPASIELLKKWIDQGAYDPREQEVSEKVRQVGLPVERAGDHWSYRPLVSGVAPELAIDQSASVSRNAIDAFLAAKLQEEDITVAALAGRKELLRRLSYDLIGLPPTVEQLESFSSDPQPDAYERVVDRFLASPKFGQRMARRWMDVARYAESVTLRGLVLTQAWRYRDYLISAFAEDRPLDQFTLEQIAGDLLKSSSMERRQQQLIATSFLALGNTNLEEQDKPQLEMDYIDEQLDVIGRVFMGQTLGCARCHDHKFDPIPTRDYYAMAGIFKAARALEHENVSKWIDKPLPMKPDDESLFARTESELANLAKEEADIEQKLGKKSDSPKSTGTSVDPATLPGIVVDDESANKIGQWISSRAVKPFVGGAYIHDGNQPAFAKTVTFQPNKIPEGQYEIRFAYSHGNNRARNASVRVFSADGEKAISIDQTKKPPIDDLWISLGQFRFEKDGQAFVLVSNEKASGHVVADAVQFLPLAAVAQAQPVVAKANSPGVNSEVQSLLPSGEQKKLETRIAEIKDERKRLEGMLTSRPSYLTIDEKLPAKDIPIHIRGNVHNLGPVVPRGFLQCAQFEPPKNISAETSGRLEFAQWLIDPRHPLTSRVLVNRLWLWVMGAGLVRTVDNFGTTGEPPTHPELLDFLATRLIEHNWSAKESIRQMLLSASYQRGVDADERAAELDPDNRYWSHSSRKRLEVESLRDAMLSVSGELRIPIGGSTLRNGVKDDYRYEHEVGLQSIYLPLLRNSLPELYDEFDFPNSSISSGQRSQSVVSPQALAMMNSPWIQARARAAADTILAEGTLPIAPTSADWAQLVKEICLTTIGREPTQNELYSVQQLISELEDKKSDRSTIIARIVHGLFASIDFRYLD